MHYSVTVAIVRSHPFTQLKVSRQNIVSGGGAETHTAVLIVLKTFFFNTLL